VLHQARLRPHVHKGSDGKVSLSGALCDVATYNVGSNTAGCQKCGEGLTTATNGSTSASDCSECLLCCAVLSCSGLPSAYCQVLYNSSITAIGCSNSSMQCLLTLLCSATTAALSCGSSA
jgi:hypothetical protein